MKDIFSVCQHCTTNRTEDHETKIVPSNIDVNPIAVANGLYIDTWDATDKKKMISEIQNAPIAVSKTGQGSRLPSIAQCAGRAVRWNKKREKWELGRGRGEGGEEEAVKPIARCEM